MPQYVYEIEMKVRDYECDLQGVVNNANYQHYMEHARHEFLESTGTTFSALHARGIDAMVSRWSDLKFSNPYPFPVYLLGRTSGGRVTFEVYGKPDGMRYRTESRVLARIPPPAAQMREGEEDRTVRAEKEGIRSESYLLVYDASGALLQKKLLRRDSYAAVQGIYEVKRTEVLPEQTPVSALPCE